MLSYREPPEVIGTSDYKPQDDSRCPYKVEPKTKVVLISHPEVGEIIVDEIIAPIEECRFGVKSCDPSEQDCKSCEKDYNEKMSIKE